MRRSPTAASAARPRPAQRIGLGAAGVFLVVLPILLLSGLHEHTLPRGLLLLPVAGVALIVAAVC